MDGRRPQRDGAPMKRKPILCLDFDGVVHSYASGWKGPRTIPDAPGEGALEYMTAMLNSGWDVCIFSSRGGYFLGRWHMRRWLFERAHGDLDMGGEWGGLPGKLGLKAVRFPLFKPPARVTLDDRALTFEGTWPSIQELEEFVPWNWNNDTVPP